MKIKYEENLLGFCYKIRDEHPNLFNLLLTKVTPSEISLLGLYLHFISKNSKLRSLKLEEFHKFLLEVFEVK
jgi:hypothetical protein